MERELERSKEEVRLPWWDVKNASRLRLDSPSPVERKMAEESLKLTTNKQRKESKTYRRAKGHFEMTFLDVPCRVCGDPDHPALREIEDEYGVIAYDYVCPMASVSNWELTCMRPCPRKMAVWCRWDEKAVEKAWSNMVSEGWGQFRSSKVIGNFLFDARWYCREKCGELEDEEGGDFSSSRKPKRSRPDPGYFEK